MKRRVKDDAAWWAENFPAAHARAAADKAIDMIDPSLPMTAFFGCVDRGVQGRGWKKENLP